MYSARRRDVAGQMKGGAAAMSQDIKEMMEVE